MNEIFSVINGIQDHMNMWVNFYIRELYWIEAPCTGEKEGKQTISALEMNWNYIQAYNLKSKKNPLIFSGDLTTIFFL